MNAAFKVGASVTFSSEGLVASLKEEGIATVGIIKKVIADRGCEVKWPEEENLDFQWFENLKVVSNDPS